MTSRHRLLLALTGAIMMFANPALAQSPAPASGARPQVRFVLPLPPGSAQDAMARRLSERLGPVWGQPALVDNKPGASGLLATDAVAKAVADGSVLSFTMASPITIAPHTFRKLPYDPMKDLKPVIQVGTTPLLLVVNASNPARNLKEFLDNARKSPGKVSFASFGSGSSAHLMGEELNRKSGVTLLHVPYKTVATTDLLGGVVDSMISDIGSIKELLRPPAKLRVLAMTGERRNRDYPDVPTFTEQGYPSLDPMVGWIGIFAPVGTPDATVARLAADLGQIVTGADWRDIVQNFGYEPSGLSGAALRKFLQDDFARWGAMAKAANVELQ
jgi:tripartite-type tricarboxylate transporter receptor subunit TctC